jgi:hypothetical protein
LAVAQESVNFPWALCFSRTDAAALASLRLVAGLEVAEDAGMIWVRGQMCHEQLETKLAALPAGQRFEWLATNLLRPIDQRIPAAQLPKLAWQPLNSWLQVELPPLALPAVQPAAVCLRLVRSSREQEADLLLTSLAEFSEFAAGAAQVRLERLQFAADSDGAVLVRGQPLPALPGRRFVLHSGVAVPAGFAWEPAVSPEVLARRFGVSGNAVVLWTEDGTVTHVHQEQFVPASRSAVRATATAVETE